MLFSLRFLLISSTPSTDGLQSTTEREKRRKGQYCGRWNTHTCWSLVRKAFLVIGLVAFDDVSCHERVIFDIKSLDALSRCRRLNLKSRPGSFGSINLKLKLQPGKRKSNG